MKQYEMFELCFDGSEPEGSHTEIDLEAIFTVDGTEKKVRGFYAGNGKYKVRFLPEIPGEYRWEIHGCMEASRKETCERVCGNGAGHGIVRAARCDRAAELLANTQLQIQDISHFVGYDDISYFTKTFKSCKGVSPREYREKKKFPPVRLQSNGSFCIQFIAMQNELLD